jgi:hypothetical protein
MNYPTFIGLDATTAEFITAAVVLVVLFPMAPVEFVQCSRGRRPVLRDHFESDYNRDFLAFVSAHQRPGSSVVFLKNTFTPIIVHKNHIRRRASTGLSGAAQ